MATVITRSVVSSFKYPYFLMVFIDTAAPAHPEVDNHPGTVDQGRLMIDISNDCGFDQAGTILTNATRLWSEGADFLTIWRKYTDV